jgi:hypothetical protein
MSQTYAQMAGTDTLTTSRTTLNNNTDALLTQFTGTAFPTTNIGVGMNCYRSDQSKTYTLTSTGPAVWVLINNLAKTPSFNEDNLSTIANAATALGNLNGVSYGAAQTLTATQKTQVQSNIFVAPTTQVFTSGSGTYTKPTGCTRIKVRMVGGGGAGGNAVGSTSGGGGGAGGYVEANIPAPSATYSYAVGAAGGTTTFGTSLLTAGAGDAGASSSTSSFGGAGGSASGGFYNALGIVGYYGWAQSPIYVGGAGAGTPFGPGASGGGTNNGNGQAANVFGAGGGGGVGGGVGGAGAGGIIIIEEFYGS